MRWDFARSAIAAALVLLGTSAAAEAAAPLQVRVVVVTTFEVGADTGDVAGEFQNWVEHYPLDQVLPFPQGFHALRYNAKDHVLGIVTGEAKAHAAASIMALGLDPRFDLTHAYWILAGIDGREMPADWSTGILPYDRATPYEMPAPPAVSQNGVQAYHLNEGLVAWAYGLTRDLKLPDDAKLQAARAGYPDMPNAQKPPFVLKGDTLTADRFWIGARMSDWAEKWVPYWTGGQGHFATSAEEDTAYLQALTMLAQAHKVDLARALDLRTGSDFTIPPKGTPAAAFLKTEAQGDYAAFAQAIASAYQVGSPVVRELAEHWDLYGRKIPGPQ
jgi:purine nucleoside permease